VLRFSSPQHARTTYASHPPPRPPPTHAPVFRFLCHIFGFSVPTLNQSHTVSAAYRAALAGASRSLVDEAAAESLNLCENIIREQFQTLRGKRRNTICLFTYIYLSIYLVLYLYIYVISIHLERKRGRVYAHNRERTEIEAREHKIICGRGCASVRGERTCSGKQRERLCWNRSQGGPAQALASQDEPELVRRLFDVPPGSESCVRANKVESRVAVPIHANREAFSHHPLS